ncbi:MAG: translation initiation factor IF-2 subunit beta [Candidatus Aenigmatarchaeota archaeon]
MDYEELLKKAQALIPRDVKESERFSIPEVELTLSGRLTVIKNFNQIANILRRDPHHLMKFLLKELAIPGKIEENKLILQKAFEKEELDKLIRKYCDEFVFCKECKKADTNLIKRNNLMFLKCEACGAERSVKKI